MSASVLSHVITVRLCDTLLLNAELVPYVCEAIYCRSALILGASIWTSDASTPWYVVRYSMHCVQIL